MKFSLWLEVKENWVYHVTLLRNLSDIGQQGLVPNANNSTWQSKQAWVKGKNFFSADINNVRYWIDTLQQIIFHRYETGGWHENNFVNEQAIPIVLRFRFNQRPTTTRWKPDTESDVGANDYFTNKSINSQGIQWWDGQKWKSVFDENLNYNLFVKKDYKIGAKHWWTNPNTDREEEIPENEKFYWEFIEPYPFPRA